MFFRKGVEGRILFRYADNGKVDALVHQRKRRRCLAQSELTRRHRKKASRTAR